MFTNFSLGVESAFLHMKSIMISFLYHQMVLGFAFGFLAATGIYIVLLAEEPAHIAKILIHKPNVCFEKIATKDDKGTYQTSYSEFQKTYNKIKSLFYITILIFLLVAGFSLIR